MNWKFTRKLTPIAFDCDEPFCMIFPLKRGLVEDFEPEIRAIESDKEVREAYLAWADSRRGFNEDLRVAGSQAQAQQWQKDYFRGSVPGQPPAEPAAGAVQGPRAPGVRLAPPDHRTKLKLREFKPAS
jgi:hypothetical protein